MVFDFSAQMKMAQSLTELTLKNISAATDAANQNTNSSSAISSQTSNFSNPFAEMMDPKNWSNFMTPGASNSQTPALPSMWWPLEQSFLNAGQPKNMGMQTMGLPNMAVPLGLNPFGGTSDNSKFSLPILSATSPLAGSNAKQLPNMFWWLVHNQDENEHSSPEEPGAALAPWAMVMDPFGLLKNVEPKPEKVENRSTSTNLMEMMFDPFGLFTDKSSQSKTKQRGTVSTRTVKNQTADTNSGSNIDYFDPFSLMKSVTGNSPAYAPANTSNENSRNLFVGFQPGAKHPLMNSGQPTGMYYLAIALPKEIQDINPLLPPWNMAL